MATHDIASVSFLLAKGGAPTDDLVCDLCDDASGEPGTVIVSSASFPGSSLSTLSLTAALFDFSGSPPTVTEGTLYWLVLRRTGSLSFADLYAFHDCVGDTAPADSTRGYYDGSAWHIGGSGDNHSRWQRVNYVGEGYAWSGYDSGVSGPFGTSSAHEITGAFVPTMPLISTRIDAEF